MMTNHISTTVRLAFPSKPHGNWRYSRTLTRHNCAFALLIPAILGFGCQSASPPPPVEYTTETWQYKKADGVVLTTQHFAIHTTCTSKPLLNALPAFMETCWQAYAELIPPFEPIDKPAEAYLFQNRWHWERFTEEFSPRRAPIYKKIRRGGYAERGVTVSHYYSQRSTFSLLAHESLHQFIEITRERPIPAWLNEGLATHFESFTLDQHNRPVFISGKNAMRTPSLRRALVEKRLMPLTEVLTTNPGVEIHKPGVYVGSYYGQVWSLVAFLSHNPRNNPYHDGYRQLLQELGTETMERKARAFLATDTDGTMSHGEAVFRAYITDDLETFEEAYTQFLFTLLHLES